MTNDIDRLEATYSYLFERCFDFSPPEGWLRIVAALLADIDHALMEAEVPAGVFSIRQVKEKFGGLRVYVDGLPTAPYSLASDLGRISTADEGASSAPIYRDWYFDGICNVEFDEGIDAASIARILAAIQASACVSEAVAQRIRQRIDVACKHANSTCQLCSAVGVKEIQNGWYLTVCKDHRDPAARVAWYAEREQRQ